nr:MAG TPA: hypothetical protein [Caudoviricetes sp.]
MGRTERGQLFPKRKRLAPLFFCTKERTSP